MTFLHLLLFIQQRAGNYKVIQESPVAFKTISTSLTSCHQIRQVAQALQFPRLYSVQDFCYRAVVGIIVKISHYNNVGILPCCHHRINGLFQNRCSQQPVRFTLLLTTTSGWHVANKHVERILRKYFSGNTRISRVARIPSIFSCGIRMVCTPSFLNVDD